MIFGFFFQLNLLPALPSENSNLNSFSYTAMYASIDSSNSVDNCQICRQHTYSAEVVELHFFWYFLDIIVCIRIHRIGPVKGLQHHQHAPLQASQADEVMRSLQKAMDVPNRPFLCAS